METQQNLAAELASTQARLAELTDEVARNTQILKRSQERELQLLEADDLQVLFERMSTGLARSYGLDAVSVVLCDPDHDVRHLLLAAGAGPEEPKGLLLVDSLTGLTPQYVALREPWLGPYSAPDHQLVFPTGPDLASIAMIPIRHKGRLLGSINFGSRDPDRFTEDHASDFFAHLGVIASFALENSVNRARLRRSGFTDVLTGWYNRRYLHVRLGEELARARRHGSALTCLMLDIDFFKSVNDTWGHAAGDQVLREITQRIESEIRATDVAARYGGEEFVMLLPDTDGASGVLLAERVRESVSAALFDIGDGRHVEVTASIGVATATPKREESDLKTAGEALIARADVALYRAKSGGRNRVALNKDE